MDKIIPLILILTILTLSQPAYETQLTNLGTITNQTTTLIWENGFEEGNFSAWTATYLYPGQSLTCTTAANEATPPHHGNYQAKADINASLLSTAAYAYKDLQDSYTTINLRFYVYLSTYYTPTQPHETYLGTIASAEYILCQIGLTDTTGQFVFITYQGTSTTILYSSKTLTPNTWHCIEIQRTQHSQNGEYHMWLDETELAEFSRTNLDTSSYTTSRIYAGNYHGCAYHHPDHVTFYIDCVAVSNTYIGKE